jgi:Mg/Co/Ni transporter MgtE
MNQRTAFEGFRLSTEAQIKTFCHDTVASWVELHPEASVDELLQHLAADAAAAREAHMGYTMERHGLTREEVAVLGEISYRDRPTL